MKNVYVLWLVAISSRHRMAVMFFITIALTTILFAKSWSSATEYPVILWWTPLTTNYHLTENCGLGKCHFTDNRTVVNNHDTKGILFYGSNFNATDLPLPRRSHHTWGLLHEESPKNEPILQHEDVLKHFNFTSTFSRYSDVPLTLQYLKDLQTLLRDEIVPLQEKNNLKRRDNLAPILYLQSHCDASSGRDEYVKELMNFIEIDSYGSCLNNKKLPEELTVNYLHLLDSEKLYKFVATYKFHIAFENAVCNDYITEKLWRPLIVGSVPIYFGSPKIEDWLPNNKSVILIRDFSSPKQLADFIKFLDANDDEYEKFLKHKTLKRNGISNERLINSLSNDKFDSMFTRFQCFVCNQIYKGDVRKFANGKHYDCGEKLILPMMQTDMSNFYWYDMMKAGKCEAKVLNELLQKNEVFSKEEFYKKVDELFKSLN